MAEGMGRCPSTVSSELRRNAGLPSASGIAHSKFRGCVFRPPREWLVIVPSTSRTPPQAPQQQPPVVVFRRCRIRLRQIVAVDVQQEERRGDALPCKVRKQADLASLLEAAGCADRRRARGCGTGLRLRIRGRHGNRSGRAAAAMPTGRFCCTAPSSAGFGLRSARIRAGRGQDFSVSFTHTSNKAPGLAQLKGLPESA